MKRALRAARGLWWRLLLCTAAGTLVAWLWHLGYADPPWRWDDPAFWLHLATEGMVAAGIGGSLFILWRAAERYLRAQRHLREGRVAGEESSR
jgi:hypothetical protein